MSEKRINGRIVLKHDVESNWKLATGFTPMAGEIIIYDIDSNYSYERIKIGDGVHNVNALPFYAGSWNELSDKPFGSEGLITVEWDGDTTGLPVSSDGTVYKISDLKPTSTEVIGGKLTFSRGNVEDITSDIVTNHGYIISIYYNTILINTSNGSAYDYNLSVTLPEPGIYFQKNTYNQLVSFSYGNETIHYLDEKYIPNTIARVSDVEGLIDAIPTPDVSGQIEVHNTSETAHSDIRTSISDLKTLVGDTTVSEQISDAIAEIPTQAQADLSQVDNTAIDYVKGVIRKESLPEGYPYKANEFEPITWDGNIEGKDNVTIDGLIYYKISDLVLSVEDLTGATMTISGMAENGFSNYLPEVFTIDVAHIQENSVVVSVIIEGLCQIMSTSATIVDGSELFPSTGTYVLYIPAGTEVFAPNAPNYCSSLTKETIYKLDPVFYEMPEIPEIPDPDVFWATYGTTTFAEITSAVGEGKTVLVKNNNYICRLSCLTSKSASFLGADANWRVRFVFCENDDSWNWNWLDMVSTSATHEITGKLIFEQDALQLKSPDGSIYQITIDNNGVPTFVSEDMSTTINPIIVDEAFSATSTNPIQNKVVNEAILNINALIGDTAVADQINTALVDNQANWNQNDTTKADYIKNRPFYSEDPVEQQVLANTSLDFDGDDSYFNDFSVSIEVELLQPLEPGVEYIVTFNGTEYRRTAFIDGYRVVVGNAAFVAGSDTGEPFLIATHGGIYADICVDHSNRSVHTFSIVAMKVNVHKIDMKYIPDCLMPKTTFVELVESDWIDDGSLLYQVVEINGITTNSKVDLQPTAYQILDLQNNDTAFILENDDGVVTAYCLGGRPTKSYSMQVLITEVIPV